MFKDRYQMIEPEMRDAIAVVWLNRPEVHNAFNGAMLKEVSEILREIDENDDIRVVIFSGRGKSFSAGADLNWMREMVKFSYEENLEEASLISDVFYRIYTLKKPVIAAINGATIGGGMGFVGAADLVVSSDRARFSLSEVRIGVVPACISPYLIKKAGEGVLRELFISGVRFGPERALEARLINYVVDHDRLLEFSLAKAEELLVCGPQAMAMCKELFLRVPEMDLKSAYEYTADLIARMRTTDEAQEGMKAFLEKRNPSWHPQKKQK